MNSKANAIRNRIRELEEEHNVTLSTAEKLLLSIEGPIVNSLDTLYGEVKLFVLEQEIKKATKEIAELVDIEEGNDVDFREVIVHKHGRPLVYGMSYIPKERCSDQVISKLLSEELTTGNILLEREIETTRKINKISIVKPKAMILDLFHSNEEMLLREYVMIHKKKIVIWTREVYPIGQFK